LWSCVAKRSATSQTNKQNKQEKKKLDAYLVPPLLPCGSHAGSNHSAAPSSCSKLPSKLPCSKLGPARRLWSSGDGVRGGGVGRW
jgi:hypothetical protein